MGLTDTATLLNCEEVKIDDANTLESTSRDPPQDYPAIVQPYWQAEDKKKVDFPTRLLIILMVSIYLTKARISLTS